jgi:hypothetical protein
LTLFAERRLWMKLPKTPLSLALVLLVLLSATTRAQSPGPREFLNTPVNQAIAWVDFVGATSETLDADLPLPNNESVSRVVAPTILASFPFKNRYAGVSLTVPYSKVEVTGPAGNLETWGFNDPAFVVHANIFGLPALTRDQIAQAIPQTFLTFHLTVNPPLGSYDRNAPVNTGANRWAFTPLLNLNIPLNKGVTWIEVYGWVRFFTNNNEFQGSNLLSQHPVGTVSAWYSRNLGKKCMSPSAATTTTAEKLSSITFLSTIRRTAFEAAWVLAGRSGSSERASAMKTRHRSRTPHPGAGYWCSSYRYRPFLDSEECLKLTD